MGFIIRAQIFCWVLNLHSSTPSALAPGKPKRRLIDWIGREGLSELRFTGQQAHEPCADVAGKWRKRFCRIDSRHCTISFEISDAPIPGGELISSRHLSLKEFGSSFESESDSEIISISGFVRILKTRIEIQRSDKNETFRIGNAGFRMQGSAGPAQRSKN